MTPLVLLEEKTTLPKNTSGDDLLQLLAEILKKPFIEELSLRAGNLTVRRKGVPDDPLIDAHVLQLAGVLDRIELEEIECQEPYKTLFQMFFRVSTRGLEISHVVVNNFRSLRKWLQLPEMVSLGGKLFGARVIHDDSLPAGVLLVCGSPRRGLDVNTIQFAVKTVLLEEIHAGD